MSGSNEEWNWEDEWDEDMEGEGDDELIFYTNKTTGDIKLYDDDPVGPPKQDYVSPSATASNEDWKWQDEWDEDIEGEGDDELIFYKNKKTGDIKFEDDEPVGPPTKGYVSPEFIPSAAAASNDPDDQITEWFRLLNGTWKNLNNGTTQQKKPKTTWHKAKDESGKIYYYDESEEPIKNVDKIPDLFSDDGTNLGPSEDNVILDYNPSSISAEQVEKYKYALGLADQDDLPFPLPKLDEIDLKTYNIHYTKGIYADVTKFNEKVNTLKEKIKGKRTSHPNIIAANQVIDYYNQLVRTIQKEKKYIYFPHIEFTARGCFLIAQDDSEQRLDESDPIIYKVIAYTQPTFDKELEGTTFSSPEDKATYDAGDPEYKFYYAIKFESCIGECGIIQLHYLLIKNIMTETDPAINTSATKDHDMFKADLTQFNSILIINSGKNSIDQVIDPDPDVLKYVDEFEKSKVPVTKLDAVIKEDDKFSVIFDNNYRRNVLEMIFFFSDVRNENIDNIKEIKPDLNAFAENLVAVIDKHSRSNLNEYPQINKAAKNYMTGGGKKPKKLRMFLDRLKRMYNRYVRRNNKRSKKKRPVKKNTRRKKKNGNKKSKKN